MQLGRARAHTVVLATALAIALVPGLARAQECAEGRVASAETAGRCCWPGQTWAAEAGACAGAPACPSPFVAHGDTCVVPASAPAAVEAAPLPPLPPVPPRAALGSAQGAFDLELREEPELSIRHTLVGSGVAGVLATWTATASLSTITVGWSPFHLLPVVGPLISAAILPSWNATGAWIYGAASTSLQIVSWVMVIVGLVDRRPAGGGSEDQVRLDARGLSVAF